MEENTGNIEPMKKRNWTEIIILIGFLITIFLLAMIYVQFFPITQQAIKCSELYKPTYESLINSSLKR